MQNSRRWIPASHSGLVTHHPFPSSPFWLAGPADWTGSTHSASFCRPCFNPRPRPRVLRNFLLGGPPRGDAYVSGEMSGERAVDGQWREWAGTEWGAEEGGLAFAAGIFEISRWKFWKRSFSPRNSIDENYYRLSLHSREWKGRFLSRRSEEESGNCAIWEYGFLLYGEEDGVWKVEEGREIFTFLSFKSYLGEGEDLQFAMHGGGWSVIIVGLDGRYGGREKLEKDEDLS